MMHELCLLVPKLCQTAVKTNSGKQSNAYTTSTIGFFAPIQFIEMDFEFPPFFDTLEKQAKRAQQLALQHLGDEVVSAQHVEFQGMFSKTVKVSFKDGRDIIIQFRVEPLDTEPFARARIILGDRVPIIEALDDPELVAAEIWPFYMNCIPGKPWAYYEEEWNEIQRVNASQSLGLLFGGCFCEGDAADVVDNIIFPHLRTLRALERDDVKPFLSFIDKMIEEAPKLRSLPLFLGHYDLNDMNVLTDGEGRVTGIVDWELSPGPQPFGIALYCIHFLAGEIIDRKFRERPSFEAMERGFWESLIESAPASIREMILRNLEAVQTAALIGILFRVMAIEGDQVMISPVLLKALPQLMCYQIPMIRGSRTAYATYEESV
jgi:hypothetical protein